MSGGMEESCSRFTANAQGLPPAARSFCDERLSDTGYFERRPTLSLKKLSAKKESAPKTPLNANVAFRTNRNQEVSEIGSVFESQLGGEASSPLVSLEQVKNLNFLRPGAIANKDMTLEEILQKQEVNLQEDMSNLRKKVCKKGFEVLHKEKGLANDHAKKISLMLDGMVKRRYPDERGVYFPIMKKLYRAIRVRQFLIL